MLRSVYHYPKSCDSVFCKNTNGNTLCQAALLNQPQDLQLEVVLHLQPRFLYSLAQTSRHFFRLFKSEKYWARVALHLASRTTFNKYYLVMGFKGYKRSMDIYIDEVRTFIKRKESKGRAKAGLSKLPTWELINHFAADNHYGHVFIPSHSIRTARYLIEDLAGRDIEMKTLLEQFTTNRTAVLPVVDGSFISSQRRANRATARFLQTVDDARSLTLPTKRKLVDLAKDMLEYFSVTSMTRGFFSFQDAIDSLVKDDFTRACIWRGFAMLNMDMKHVRGNKCSGNLVLNEAKLPSICVLDPPILFWDPESADAVRADEYDDDSD